MKKLFGVALVLLVLVSSAFCASSRGKPTSPSTDSGGTWATERSAPR